MISIYMSNLAVINFVANSLTISGKTTLASELLSSSTAIFQGINTTDFKSSGLSTFDNLPVSSQTPTLIYQLTNKKYVNDQDTILDTKIENTDLDRKSYIDNEITVLDTKIETTDLNRKSYIDDADTVLDSKIETTDLNRKSYIDEVLDGKITTVNERITSTDASQRFYIDQQFVEKTGGRPSFYAYNRNTTQTLTNQFEIQLKFNEIAYNYLGKYSNDPSEMYFQPIGYEGFYLVEVSVTLDNVTNLKLQMNKISYPNGPNNEGLNTLEGTESFSSATAKTVTLYLNAVVYLNGMEETTAIPSSDRVFTSLTTTQQQDILVNGGGLRNKIFFTAHYLHP